MGKRLKAKHKKARKDQEVNYNKGEGPKRHRQAEIRSKKHLKKNANRMK